MRIAVPIKRVPDTETRFTIAADGKSVDSAGLKYDMSDFDGYAVEVALRLAETHEGSEVTVISVGPDAVQETIRKALSMGAARGIQLKAADVLFDGFAIAQALAAELKEGNYDLILFGRNATDSANGVVGTMTAELLGLPCVSAISELHIDGTSGTARRELEGAAEIVEFPLPAVLTIDEGIARPRLPGLKGIMAAKKKPIEVREAALGRANVVIEKMALPPERAAGRIVGEGADAVPELVRLLQNEAKVL
ncbi:MAG TPA: electron transfer flavoprotein subunit beta/FixA family protein [Gemmatimonadales bacterium]|jgi:electron transfer flavoprotein beta subunit|nr:electron transfer flavoprotein subunit beta/FixA family protein [Gemmatimonadales bacterium]